MVAALPFLLYFCLPSSSRGFDPGARQPRTSEYRARVWIVNGLKSNDFRRRDRLLIDTSRRFIKWPTVISPRWPWYLWSLFAHTCPAFQDEWEAYFHFSFYIATFGTWKSMNRYNYFIPLSTRIYTFLYMASNWIVREWRTNFKNETFCSIVSTCIKIKRVIWIYGLRFEIYLYKIAGISIFY